MFYKINNRKIPFSFNIFVLCLMFYCVKGPSAFATQKILFLGDSLTEGYGIKKESSYPHLIEKILVKEGQKDIQVINAGVNGSKSSSGLSRLKWHLRSKPTILVLALGANDGLRGVDPSVMKKNLQETIDLALKSKLTVLLVGIKIPFNYGDDFRIKFENSFAELLQLYKNKIDYVPFLLEGVGGVKKYNLPDGIHPNVEGHKKLAENVLKYLRPLLGKK